jgi:hypothetical protein
MKLGVAAVVPNGRENVEDSELGDEPVNSRNSGLAFTADSPQAVGEALGGGQPLGRGERQHPEDQRIVVLLPNLLGFIRPRTRTGGRDG